MDVILSILSVEDFFCERSGLCGGVLVMMRREDVSVPMQGIGDGIAIGWQHFRHRRDRMFKFSNETDAPVLVLISEEDFTVETKTTTGAGFKCGIAALGGADAKIQCVTKEKRGSAQIQSLVLLPGKTTSVPIGLGIRSYAKFFTSEDKGCNFANRELVLHHERQITDQMPRHVFKPERLEQRMPIPPAPPAHDDLAEEGRMLFRESTDDHDPDYRHRRKMAADKGRKFAQERMDDSNDDHHREPVIGRKVTADDWDSRQGPELSKLRPGQITMVKLNSNDHHDRHAFTYARFSRISTSGCELVFDDDIPRMRLDDRAQSLRLLRDRGGRRERGPPPVAPDSAASDLGAMSIKELKAACAAVGLRTSDSLDKRDLVKLLLNRRTEQERRQRLRQGGRPANPR